LRRSFPQIQVAFDNHPRVISITYPFSHTIHEVTARTIAKNVASGTPSQIRMSETRRHSSRTARFLSVTPSLALGWQPAEPAKPSEPADAILAPGLDVLDGIGIVLHNRAPRAAQLGLLLSLVGELALWVFERHGINARCRCRGSDPRTSWESSLLAGSIWPQPWDCLPVSVPGGRAAALDRPPRRPCRI